MTVRENLIIRPYQWSDMKTLADIANAVNEKIGAEHRTTADELRSYFETPSFDMANDSFIIERDGEILGMSDLEFSKATGRGWADGAVSPDHWGEGIGSQLVSLAEARCMDRAQAECPPDMPISIIRYTPDGNTAAIRLFERRGYQHTRSFYQMRMALDQPVDAPLLPGTLELRDFTPEAVNAIYEANEEAFADHWGFEREDFADWEQYVLKSPQTDTSLWLIAYDGDEIAGLAINRPYGEGDPKMGYVGTLGVRRAWRKQGLGLALLKHSFARFQERGYTRAGLGVDAASLTNAVALYERAGMHIHTRSVVYTKMLRT